MAFLSWHPRFSLGHPEVDGQHKQLFELINQFDDVIKLGLTADSGPIIDALTTSTEAHFRFEEALMQNIGFPGFTTHKQMHKELAEQLRDMLTKMRVGGHVSQKSVVRFLADWLTNHIIREDMEYKSFLKERG